MFQQLGYTYIVAFQIYFYKSFVFGNTYTDTMAAQPPVDPGMQHEPPPLFYCWKYWLTNGGVAEGCTSVNPLADESSMPDLNMYGWMYIVIPLAALMLLLLLLYCCCKTKHTPAKHQVLLEDV